MTTSTSLRSSPTTPAGSDHSLQPRSPVDHRVSLHRDFVSQHRRSIQSLTSMSICLLELLRDLTTPPRQRPSLHFDHHAILNRRRSLVLIIASPSIMNCRHRRFSLLADEAPMKSHKEVTLFDLVSIVSCRCVEQERVGK